MTTPVFTTGPSSSAFKAQQEFTAPLSQVLTAEAQAAWLYSPTSSLDRMMELNAAEADVQETEYGPQLVPDTGVGIPLAQEAAQGRAKAAGVKLDIPAHGITQGALDILVRRKQEENDRKEILQRADNDLLTGALRLGTGLGVSLLDPINVASAFIPVVGITRYSNMLAAQSSRLGRAGVRLKVGGAEGAFGAALVEPIILTAADAEQADYDLTDSMLNIAFGTIMGGGLHAGAGAFGDAIKARQNRVSPVGSSAEALMNASPEVRQAMARGAMSQMATGRMVDVEVIGNFTPVRSTERRVLVPGKEPEIVTPNTDDAARKIAPELTAKYDALTERKKTYRRWLDELKQPQEDRVVSPIDDQIAEIDAKIQKASAKNRARLNREKAVLEQERRFVAEEVVKRGDTPDMAQVHKDLQAVDEQMRDLAPQLTDVYQKARSIVKENTTTTPGEAPTYKVETVFERDRTPGIGRQIEETFAAERYYLADKNASDEIAARVATAKVSDDPTVMAQEELSDVMSQLTDELRRLDLEDVDFKAEDAAIAQADDMAKAMDAAASCMLRRA
jgi:hypothetical protein